MTERLLINARKFGLTHIKLDKFQIIAFGNYLCLIHLDFEAVASLREMVESEPSFVSVYSGEDAVAEETEKIEAFLREAYPAAEVLVVEGGQPLYDYVISVE